MLCYAWNVLPRSDNKLTGLEKFDNIYNLLAKLIISEVNSLIKRGFHKEYIDHEEELATLKGKIEVGKSINQQAMIRKRLVCKFDEFSDNVAFNQVTSIDFINNKKVIMIWIFLCLLTKFIE